MAKTTPRSRKTLVLLTSLTVAGATGAAMMRGGAESGSHATETAADAPSGLAARRGLEGERQGPEGPCSWPAGRRMAYDVQTEVHTVMDMGSLMDQVQLGESNRAAAQATTVDQAATRHWHVDLQTVAQATDGSTILAAHIEAEPTQIAGSISQPPMPGLSETFLVRMDPRCSIREFGWRSDGDLEAARDQQQLLAGLGYLAPERDESGYGGLVFDVVGRYYARYSIEGDGSIAGRAVSYREPFGRAIGPGRPTFEIGESVIEITPERDAWFASLRNERTVSMSIFGQSVGTMQSSIVARRTEPGDWQPTVRPEDDGWTWGLLLGQPQSASRRAKARSGSALAGVAVGEALDQYLAIILERGSSIDAVPHLVAWLRANPDGAASLVAQLRGGALDGQSSGSAGLFLALGKAGTPQASDALLDILRGAGDTPSHKVSAAHALANIEDPTEAMIDAVVAVFDDSNLDSVTRGSLAMSLGSFAQRNGERAPELAERARGQIEQWLTDPADDSDLAGSLLAAGNAGHDDLAPAIDPYFEHEDPQIRQRAAHALRHMSPEEAYPRLSEGMLDEDESVRASAIETAVEVSRNRGASVPEDMVDTAIEQLDLQTPAREQKALLGLLGEAAKHGSEGADAVLQQHFLDELDSTTRDIDKLRALGRHSRTRWTAP